MPEDYEELIARLIANSSESQTVEFKESNDDAFMIGQRHLRPGQLRRD